MRNTMQEKIEAAFIRDKCVCCNVYHIQLFFEHSNSEFLKPTIPFVDLNMVHLPKLTTLINKKPIFINTMHRGT